jgi:hypothetical protein
MRKMIATASSAALVLSERCQSAGQRVPRRRPSCKRPADRARRNQQERCGSTAERTCGADIKKRD